MPWFGYIKNTKKSCCHHNRSTDFFILRSAEQLRAKSGKTMMAKSDGKGIAIVAEAGPIERTKWGNILQPEVLADLQG
jgi:hypothetical protein